MNNKKLINTAKNLDLIAKVMEGFMLAFSIVFAIFAVLVLVLGEKMVEAGSFTLDLDFLKLHPAEKYQVFGGAMKAYIVVGLAVSAVLLVAARYILGCLRSILSPMKEGRPFGENAPASLKRIAWCVLFGGAFAQAAAAAEAFLLYKAYPISEIISSGAVDKIEYVFTMDFSFVLVFAAVMLLSYIFEYGRSLQEESDETL